MSIELKVPEVGESVTEVAIGAWLKKEGDHVEKDEPLVELESDKATFEAPAESSGTLVEIIKQAGEMADVGEVIARLDPDGEESSPSETESGKSDDESVDEKAQGNEADGQSERQTSESSETTSEGSSDSAASDDEKSESSDEKPGRDHDDPPDAAEEKSDKDESAEDKPADSEDDAASTEHARDFEVDLSDAYQSSFGTDDRAESDQKSKSDPDAESDSAESSASEDDRTKGSDDGERVVPMSAIRRRIASRLVEAQQNAALLTTFNEIDMSAVKELRSRHQTAFQEAHNVKLGFMSFFVKAVAASLKNVPELNAEVRDNKEIVYHDGIHIGIAIGSDKGLVVPVLRDADGMSFSEIEQSIEDFARRAGRGELGPDEMQGGTFTISNGGIYGSLLSTPIVNPPQSGVLGMHTIQNRPVVRDEQIVIRPMMYVALSYDHRIIDGREAVTFLQSIRESIESPARLLLEV